MTITTVNNKGQITLPKPIREHLKIRAGDIVAVSVEGDRVVIAPKVLVDRKQAWFWTNEWQAAEHEATEDIRRGRVFHFDTADEAIASLDK